MAQKHIRFDWAVKKMVRDKANFNDIINDNLDEWIYFFKNSVVLDNFDAKGMKEVRAKLKVLNMSDDERKRYDKFLEGLSTEASIAQTLQIEAEERGAKKHEIEIAIKCIKKGFSNQEIIDITEYLSVEEIEQIRVEI